MNHPSARLAALLVTIGLLGAGQVRADQYQWTMLPSTTFSSPGKLSTVSYAVNPAATSTPSAITVSSTSTASASDSFSQSYTLQMNITDGNGQTSEGNDPSSLTFHGTLSGSVNQNNSTLVAQITDPTQTTTFDGHTYQVSLALAPVTGAVGNNGGQALTITPTVTMDPSSTPVTTPAQAPEPSALVLAGMACSACGLSGWLRRIRPRIAVA